MHRFHFLRQERMRVHIFGLDVLPDAMRVSRITPLFVEKFQRMILFVRTQLVKNSMRCEGAKFLPDRMNFLLESFDSTGFPDFL